MKRVGYSGLVYFRKFGNGGGDNCVFSVGYQHSTVILNYANSVKQIVQAQAFGDGFESVRIRLGDGEHIGSRAFAEEMECICARECNTGAEAGSQGRFRNRHSEAPVGNIVRRMNNSQKIDAL